MNEFRAAGAVSRWSPALAILIVLGLLTVLPHHVRVLPLWASCLVVLAILVPMAAITFRTKETVWWMRLERAVILLFGVAYVFDTAIELADMIGIITVHPPETRQISLLSSSLAI